MGSSLRWGVAQHGQLPMSSGNIAQKALPHATKHKTKIRAIATEKEDTKFSLFTDDVIIRLVNQDNKI